MGESRSGVGWGGVGMGRSRDGEEEGWGGVGMERSRDGEE